MIVTSTTLQFRPILGTKEESGKEESGMNLFICGSSLNMVPHFPLLIPSSHSDVIENNMKSNFGPVLQPVLKMVRAEIKQWEVSGRYLRKEPFYHVQTNFTGTGMNFFFKFQGLYLGIKNVVWVRPIKKPL